MDWKNLNADVNKILNVHFSEGRSGRTINKVIIHYNAGNLTVEGCYNLWQSRAASAHYQVESNGRIGQLVWDSDTAWHAGNWDANCSSIGVEHANNKDGTVTETCLDAGAHLVAAICLFYKLGRPEWMKNVFPHKHFSATQCPGQLAGSQNAAYMQKAQYWYDQMSGTKPTPEPTPQPTPTPSTKYSVGQHVVFSTCYKSSTAPNSEAINARNMARNHGVITKIVAGAKNPYLLDNGLCWVNDGDIRNLYSAQPTMSARDFALAVWNKGMYGTGAEREANAKKLGVNYAEAQRLINILASGGSI